MTAESRLGIVEPDDNTEEGARKRLSGHFNLETLVNAEDLDPVTDASKDFKSTEEEVEEEYEEDQILQQQLPQ